MKRIIFAAALLILLSSLPLFAQEEEGGGSDVSYLNTATNQPVSYTGTVQNPCIFPTLPFDFEPVNGDPTFDLDLVWGRSYESATVVHNANQRYNNGTGDYPNDNGSFFSATSFCSSNETVLDMLFGKLRPSNTRRDLAILRTNEIRIYHNTGSGMATNANQVISQSGSGAWGPFVAGDNYEDLVVSDGSQIRAYRNLTNGNLDLTPYTFSITASKILVAQMDENIYPINPATRFDLVSYTGSTVEVRMNNNNNTLGSPQSYNVGFTISSIAVGDFDNNNFNDIIIGGSSTVKIFPNTNGTINWTSPL
jgi:hypothetical protein